MALLNWRWEGSGFGRRKPRDEGTPSPENQLKQEILSKVVEPLKLKKKFISPIDEALGLYIARALEKNDISADILAGGTMDAYSLSLMHYQQTFADAGIPEKQIESITTQTIGIIKAYKDRAKAASELADAPPPGSTAGNAAPPPAESTEPPPPSVLPTDAQKEQKAHSLARLVFDMLIYTDDATEAAFKAALKEAVDTRIALARAPLAEKSEARSAYEDKKGVLESTLRAVNPHNSDPYVRVLIPKMEKAVDGVFGRVLG